MVRVGLFIAAFLAFAAPASAARSSAVLLECDRQEGAAEFQARMETVAGADRLRMRFTLEAQRRRRAWRRVAAPGFGEWTSAEPGVTRYLHTRRVEELVGPVRYRVHVRFWWVDAAGGTVARAHARSRACRQPDRRPDLVVDDLVVEPTDDPAVHRYLVYVRNEGRSAVDAFDLAVTGLAPVTVDGIEKDEERVVELTGPACAAGASLTAIADPQDLIDERSERDNALRRSCA
jgi:hypothetical protein